MFSVIRILLKHIPSLLQNINNNSPTLRIQAHLQPAQTDPYTAIMAELLGLKQAVQATNMMAAQQPAAPMTADDIIANIIAPKPRKED